MTPDALNGCGDYLVPNTVKDMIDSLDTLRSDANSNDQHGRYDESEPRASGSRTLAASQPAHQVLGTLDPPKLAIPAIKQALDNPALATRTVNHRWGETPAVQQNAVGQTIVEMHDVILRHESRFQELARLADDLREENRGLLKSQLTLQNHFDKLQSDYKGLLCDLDHRQIRRGDARHHREANGKASAV